MLATLYSKDSEGGRGGRGREGGDATKLFSAGGRQKSSVLPTKDL